MAEWHTVNTIVGPCRCGLGHLKSIHLTDGHGNYDTIWNLDCELCRSKFTLEEGHLVGNPDKTIAMIRYVPKKVQSLLMNAKDRIRTQSTDMEQSATSTSKVSSASS